MHLKESSSGGTARRHPWEVARLDFIRKILLAHSCLAGTPRILELGCGDGYVAFNLLPQGTQASMVALDTGFDRSQIERLSQENPGSRVCGSYDDIRGDRFELILMLDLLEHIEDDFLFLKEIVHTYLAPGGFLLIVSPAFQSLFSQHDVFMGHQRRYDIPRLTELGANSGITMSGNGHIFFSLLAPRAILRWLWMRRTQKENSCGVGAWNHSRWVTSIVLNALTLDCFFCETMRKLGIFIPGLTVWAIYQKPR